MIVRYIVACMFILSFSCNGQTILKESDELANAKWYYYSYAAKLTVYDSRNTKVNPLSCDIKLSLLKVSGDTTKMYFKTFYKDTSNECSFKPYGLSGIMVIKEKLYLPIYHSIIFERQSDSAIFNEMNRQEKILQEEILKSKYNISQWLHDESKKRKNFPY